MFDVILGFISGDKKEKKYTLLSVFFAVAIVTIALLIGFIVRSLN